MWVISPVARRRPREATRAHPRPPAAAGSSPVTSPLKANHYSLLTVVYRPQRWQQPPRNDDKGTSPITAWFTICYKTVGVISPIACRQSREVPISTTAHTRPPEGCWLRWFRFAVSYWEAPWTQQPTDSHVQAPAPSNHPGMTTRILARSLCCPSNSQVRYPVETAPDTQQTGISAVLLQTDQAAFGRKISRCPPPRRGRASPILIQGQYQLPMKIRYAVSDLNGQETPPDEGTDTDTPSCQHWAGGCFTSGGLLNSYMLCRLHKHTIEHQQAKANSTIMVL